MPARTHRIPSGSLLSCLPSPTQDWSCWLWEGKGIASARGRGPPTPRCQPSVIRNKYSGLLQQKRVHACLSPRITTVSFCFKSNGMDLRLIDGLAGGTGEQAFRRHLLPSGQHSHLQRIRLPRGGGRGTPSPGSGSQRVVPRTC